MTADVADAVDLFGPVAPSVEDEDLANALGSSVMTFTGTLKSAEVRTRVDDKGIAAPVVRVEIKVEAPVRHTVRAEQAYPTHHAAEQAAAALKKGQRISVTSPLLGMRVYLPDAEIVHPEGATAQ